MQLCQKFIFIWDKPEQEVAGFCENLDALSDNTENVRNCQLLR
jgi:hypothetical protein